MHTCSCTTDKLESTTENGKCHVCGVTTSGHCYRSQCHAVERLVDCIRVPCRYAAHGCDATTLYYEQESHRQVCPHAPCHCPGESCGFAGTVSALVDHFAGAHKWPCTTKVPPWGTSALSIRLRVGFNFLFFASRAGGGNGDRAARATATISSVPHLFLLNVTQQGRLGRAISVLGVHPHATATATANGVGRPVSTDCELVFTGNAGRLCRRHCQSSEFNVVCTDLSKGLPDPEGGFQFVVPSAALGDDEKDYIEVKVRIFIN